VASEGGGMPLEQANFWIALTIFGAGISLVRNEPLWGGPLVFIGVCYLIYALRHNFIPTAYRTWIVVFAMGAAVLTTGYDIYQRNWSSSPGQPSPPLAAPKESVAPSHPDEASTYVSKGDVTSERTVIDATPDFLIDLYKNNTSVQGDAAFEPYKGKWIAYHGLIANVVQDRDGIMVLSLLSGNGFRIVNMSFDGNDEKAVQLYTVAHPISALCQINYVSGNALNLSKCELKKNDG
jgi:hypothetical protein